MKNIRRKLLKKSVPLWFLLALSLAIMAAIALTIITIGPEKIKIYTGEIADSDFIIDSISTRLKGKNRITITIELRNGDTVAHSADVTVQLLDSNGDIISIDGEDMESTQSTGNIDGGSSITLAFTFTGSNLVRVYHSCMITIYQSS
jgi:hypothetical protein